MNRLWFFVPQRFRFRFVLLLLLFVFVFCFLQKRLEKRRQSKGKAESQLNFLKLSKDGVKHEAKFDLEILQRTSLNSDNANFKAFAATTSTNSGFDESKIKGNIRATADFKAVFDMKKSTETLKPFVQNQRVKENHIPNETTAALPLKYEKETDHPNVFPDCGMSEEMRPWFYLPQKFDMLFLIKSAPSHVQLRNLVRMTWGSVSSVRNMTFASLFVVGHSDVTEENELLKEENLLFGDLLLCEFIDSYENLPIKVLSSIRWVLEGHLRSNYYTVTDDDCLMDLVNINTFFREPTEEDVVYCGFVYDKNAFPHRKKNSKLYVSYETYPAKHFPTFCHGGMWTVRRTLLEYLYHMAEVTDRHEFHLEDVYITGILREKLGFGDRNIKPVVTRTNKKFTLMYYPYSEREQDVFMKLSLKWRKFNATLPWRSLEEGSPLMTIFKRNEVDQNKLKLIVLRWKHLMRLHKHKLTSKNNVSA